MKIRLSMQGMNLSVDVGEKANYLFIKFANQLLSNGISSEEVEDIADRLEKHEEIAKPIDNTQSSELEVEAEDSILKYKGFIYWKCKK